jgi:hypothetical protein
MTIRAVLAKVITTQRWRERRRQYLWHHVVERKLDELRH